MTLIRFKPELAEQTTFSGPTDLLRDLMNLQLRALGRAGAEAPQWSPALDVFEDGDGYTVALEAPGLKKEDFEISYHDGVLSVAGERKTTEESQQRTCFRRERCYGRFARSVSLPAEVKAEAVTANYKDGVLLVTLPKAEQAKPRQIEVGVN